MRTRNTWLTRRLALVLLLMFTLTFASPIFICATSLDSLQEQSQLEEQDGLPSSQEVSSGPHYWDDEVPPSERNVVESQSDNAMADWLRGYTPVTSENMQVASNVMSGPVKIMGNLTGCIMIFTTAAIFLVTALDLLYIGVPALRGFLNPQMAGGGAPGAGMPLGGGMGGYGGRYGGMSGGMQQGGAAEYGLRRKWVSDEAVSVVAMYAQPTSPMGGGMGGMGMMGGGMGMGMMGGGMGGMQQQQAPTKLVIFEYLKKRILFLIIFAVASTLLLSSIFTDCGINIAELGVRVMQKLNGKIAEVNV